MTLSGIGFVFGTVGFGLGLIAWFEWTKPLDDAISAWHRHLKGAIESSWIKCKRLVQAVHDRLAEILRPIFIFGFMILSVVYMASIALPLGGVAPALRETIGFGSRPMEIALYVLIAPALALINILFFTLPFYMIPAVKGIAWLVWIVLIAGLLASLVLVHYSVAWIASHPKGPVTVISFVIGAVGYLIEVLTRFYLA